jgi:hypothetical protein
MEYVMSVEELRDIIWEYLYRANEARTLDEIAAFVARDREAVSYVVDHEWFKVAQGRVSIAYTASSECM